MKIINNKKFSLFTGSIRSSTTTPSGLFSLKEFVTNVREGTWKEQVEVVRYEPDEKTKKDLKVDLPYVTLSAKFNESRKKGTQEYYTDLISLDLDKGKLNFIDDEHVAAQFHSVGGSGLCVVVKVDPISNFKHTFSAVKDYFESKHGVTVDKACSDPTRARFVTYDTDAQYFESSTIFPIPEYVKAVEVSPTVSDDWSYEITRNFVAGLLHQGFDRKTAEKMILGLSRDRWVGSSTFGDESTQDSLLIKLVDSIYGLYPEQKGQAILGQKKVKIATSFSELERDTGLFKRVRPLLPKLLQDIGDQFSRDGDQDTALMSALPIFSQLLINCYFNLGSVGLQTGQLFTYILGEAGSGKSVMGQVVKMFGEIEKEFHAERLRRHEEYNLFHSSKEAEKKEWAEMGRPVPENHFTGLFLPSDTTAASLLANVNSTSGLGILYAAEADTISKFSKGENNISTLLRNAYESESISQSRLGDSGKKQLPIHVDKLSLSVLISSTPDQVRSLIKNVDDGLFSRFMFEILPSTEKIISLWKTKKIDHEVLKVKMLDFYRKSGYKQCEPTLDPLKHTRSFSHEYLEPKDEDYMHYVEEMDHILQDLTGNVSKSLSSATTRAMTRVFRIGMILSAMRAMESRELGETEEFDSASLAAAFDIVTTSLSKTTSVLKLFGADVQKSSSKAKSEKLQAINDRVEICNSVGKDNSIDDKIQGAVDRLNSEGDLITKKSFQKWKSRYERANDVRFW